MLAILARNKLSLTYNLFLIGNFKSLLMFTSQICFLFYFFLIINIWLCYKSWHYKHTVMLKSWLKTQHSEDLDHGIRSHHFMEDRRGNNENE